MVTKSLIAGRRSVSACCYAAKVPTLSEPHSRRLCLARLHASSTTGDVDSQCYEAWKATSSIAASAEYSWDGQLNRRRALLAAAAAAIALSRGSAAVAAEPAVAAVEGAFVNKKQGYSLTVPKEWERKDKAGADTLWEDPQRRSTSVGVTVNPVRVKSIEEFGDLDAVGGRLLDAERKKESTMSVAMVQQSSRQQQDSGATLYDFEYELNSTRGRKRILNTVTIYNSKLYILNAAYKCEKPQNDSDGDQLTSCIAPVEKLNTLRQIASSFAVLPTSSNR